MTRWIDLDKLRRDIAAEAKARALAAGLEGVTVRVTIADPDRRQRRAVTIDVDAPPAVGPEVIDTIAEIQRKVATAAAIGVPAELMRGGAIREYRDAPVASTALAMTRCPIAQNHTRPGRRDGE